MLQMVEDMAERANLATPRDESLQWDDWLPAFSLPQGRARHESNNEFVNTIGRLLPPPLPEAPPPRPPLVVPRLLAADVRGQDTGDLPRRADRPGAGPRQPTPVGPPDDVRRTDRVNRGLRNPAPPAASDNVVALPSGASASGPGGGSTAGGDR